MYTTKILVWRRFMVCRCYCGCGDNYIIIIVACVALTQGTPRRDECLLDDEGRAGLPQLGQPLRRSLEGKIRIQDRAHAQPGRCHRGELSLLFSWRRPQPSGARSALVVED